MRVLVTGGAGFVGSHLVDLLGRHAHEVVVMDDLRTGLATQVPHGVRLEKLDICSDEAARFVTQWRPSIVVHLAAQVNVKASLRDPLADAQANIIGSLNLLQAAQRAGTETFIAASSGGALYGEAKVFPTPEKARLQPQSAYGASKQCMEVYADLFNRTSFMRCVSLRFSNIFGPRQSSKSEAGVISIFAKRLAKKETIVVFGDGNQSRDFIFVADAVNALFHSMQNASLKGSYNIGTGIETSLLELISLLQNLTQNTSPVHFDPPVSGEVLRSCLDASLFTRQSDWSPRCSLREGLRQTVEFLLDSPNITNESKRPRNTKSLEKNRQIYSGTARANATAHGPMGDRA